tara:strand:- start:307 stop:705 length:399 start_codon:yes stop_codon:yes gene_type:complete
MSMTASPSRKQLREFGFLLAIGFPLLLGWLLPFLRGHGFHAWTLWVAIPGLTLGLLAPRFLALPYRGWMSLGHALGWFNSHIILGAVFLLVLQPIALVMRLTGYDPLRRRHQQLTTYREVRQDKAISLKRIF